MIDALANWIFEWVAKDDIRVWIFVVVCIVAIFLTALSRLIELDWEFGTSALVGLVVSGHSGFFLGLCAFTLVFVAMYLWMGRGARVESRPAEPVEDS